MLATGYQVCPIGSRIDSMSVNPMSKGMSDGFALLVFDRLCV